MLTSNGTILGYDPLGRLQQVSRNGVVSQFVYAGDALVAEYDASGAMTRRYLHGQGADTPLVMFTGSSTAAPQYLYADHQGSVTAITDAANYGDRCNNPQIDQPSHHC